jgi:hypothetical protein
MGRKTTSLMLAHGGILAHASEPPRTTVHLAGVALRSLRKDRAIRSFLKENAKMSETRESP